VGRPKIGASHTGRGKVLGGEVCQDAERYGAAHAAISALIPLHRAEAHGHGGRGGALPRLPPKSLNLFGASAV
jgi:hypothetical protein